MSQSPCTVCGGRDLNLIDGYYYCVECGTQDTNAQETIVEHTVLGDGTFAHAASRKITQVLKDGIQMSGEWHKWHAFNFILNGLTEELIKLGASSGFPTKVLWIWTRYMKVFVDKDKMGTLDEVKEREGKEINKSIFDVEDDIDKKNTEKEDVDDKKQEKQNKKLEKLKNSIRIITKGLLLAILYLALNLDKSDIQLSHLFRFIGEGRISIVSCKKFVPVELDLKSIPNWINFMKCNKEYNPTNIRQLSMTLIKVLDLGKPLVPNVRLIVDNYITELCLPVDFKNVVFSIMHQVPCDYLDINYTFLKKNIVRIPDYEGVIMSYVLVAFKLTFGLDDHYEITLSDAVDKINDEDNHLKSYKLGHYSQPTDRLFSFREWCNYMQFRKTLLCKYYLPMAQQQNIDVDDRVFIEHLEERPKRKIKLSDEVTMDILNKIQSTEEGTVIPKSEFTPTLTPMANFTEVILQYVQDPDIKLLISEDFTQYSLKYACEDLELLNGEDNLITGVSKENKTFNKNIVGNLVNKESDFSLVYVRNCENKNWLKTNPPTLDHVARIKRSEIDKDSDLGYDSNLENTAVENEIKNDMVEDGLEPKQLENIEEEKEDISIFDDPFDDIDDADIKEENVDLETQSNSFEFNNERANITERSINDDSVLKEVKFDPKTFDRDQTIKELVLAACKKYRIPIPREYDTRGIRKRKPTLVMDKTGVIIPKKRKISQITQRGQTQREINEILATYYASVEKNLLHQVSEHFKSVVKDYVELDNENETNEDIPLENNGNSLICDENRDVDEYSNSDKDKSFLEINDISKTVDSSLMEVETEDGTNVDDLIPKVNPKFDEKTHDTNQLYIKYSQGLQFENLLDNDDLDIDKILDRKIKECEVNDCITLCAKDLKKTEYEDSDVDDEIEEEKKFIEAKLKQKEMKLMPLVKNPKEIKKFNYWLRHYTAVCMGKNKDVKQKFDMEMKEHFPKSFSFVIQECASILDCTAFSLYRHIQNLELKLISSSSSLYQRNESFMYDDDD